MLNRPTQSDIEAIRAVYGIIKPVKAKPIGYRVYHCGQMVYENQDIKLCWHFIKQHSLKAKPKGIYK